MTRVAWEIRVISASARHLVAGGGRRAAGGGRRAAGGLAEGDGVGYSGHQAKDRRSSVCSHIDRSVCWKAEDLRR